MAEDRVITAGVKIGSKWSSVFSEVTGPNPTVRLTCVGKYASEYTGGKTVYHFAEAAEPYYDTVFPLKHGAPRNDAEVPLELSIDLLDRYARWLLRDIPLRSGVVCCLPAIKAKEGLQELQDTLNKLPIGQVGMVYLGEAFTAAAGTVPMERILSSQTLSINFGSTTIETVLFKGTKEIHQNVFTTGGSAIDTSLMNAIEQWERGGKVTENQARAIKERYNYETNDDIPTELTMEGGLKKVDIPGDLIKEVIDPHMDLVARKIRTFLRDAALRNEQAVNSLQIDGAGTLVLCGGMVNMPGFAHAFLNKLTTIGGISKRLPFEIPSNGVIAPAIGARYIADILEEKRIEQGVSNWNQITGDE